jgi:hypothetical protein
MHSPPSLLGSLKAALQAVQVTASVFVEQLRTLETHTNIQQYKETQASSMTLSGGLLQVSTASPALSELTSVHTEAGNILTDFLRRTAYTVGATASRGILGAGLSLPFTSLTINAGLTRALPRIFSIPAHLMRKNVDNSESQAQIQVYARMLFVLCYWLVLYLSLQVRDTKLTCAHTQNRLQWEVWSVGQLILGEQAACRTITACPSEDPLTHAATAMQSWDFGLL